MRLGIHNFLRFQNSIDSFSNIVFFAERSSDWDHMIPCMEYLISRGAKIVTLSLDLDENTFEKNEKVMNFTVNNMFALRVIFSSMKGAIVCTTITDLGENKYFVKNNNCLYAYLFHSLLSVHKIYPKTAFKNYDIIFSPTKDHIFELKKMEQIYKWRKKLIIPSKYMKFKKLVNNKFDDTENILTIAPSWGEEGLFEKYWNELFPVISKLEIKVVLRPHPETIKRNPILSKQIESDIQDFDHISLQKNVSNVGLLLKSRFLISDWSGVAFEYALVTGRPVFWFDTPEKIRNLKFEEVGLICLENSLREKLGVVIKIAEIPKIIFEDLNSLEKEKEIANLSKDWDVFGNDYSEFNLILYLSSILKNFTSLKKAIMLNGVKLNSADQILNELIPSELALSSLDTHSFLGVIFDLIRNFTESNLLNVKNEELHSFIKLSHLHRGIRGPKEIRFPEVIS